MKSYVSDDMIFALATCVGKSALAVFRVSGEGSIASFASCFSKPERLLAAKTNTLVYGTVTGVDDVVVSVYRKGHGYTGEEALEISCHGSLASISLMNEKLSQLGFRQAEPGEFTFRAFLSGKIDLTQAEAVNEIARSQSRLSQTLALERLGGALSARIHRNRDLLADAMSVIEVQLDYAEDEIGGDTSFPFDEITDARDDLAKLADTFRTGSLIGQGAKIVLAGAANAGKSSLFNLFLKTDRSIVSAVPGTTRDFIESNCEIAGINVRLFDTAGLRTAGEEIEAEGIKRTKALMRSSDLLLYLVDSSDPEDGYESISERLEKEIPGVEKLFVWNKTDLPSAFEMPEGFIELSVDSAEGFEALVSGIVSSLGMVSDSNGCELLIESPRQHRSLVESVRSLDSVLSLAREEECLDVISVEMKEALDQLGYICGELTSDDLLDRIFSSFCVGK